MKKRVLVIGAGPAGLACAYTLSKQKNKKFSVDVIEADKKVGGLSKTVNFNGYYYDIGGHRFFSKIQEINDIWDEILKDDLMTRRRLSRIYYNYKFYDYPLQIKNAFLNLGLIESSLIGASYIKSKLFPYKEEKTFEQWTTNRFGKRFYRMFFKTYTEKVWGIPCNKIQAEWANQRLKNLSLRKVIYQALPFVNQNQKTRKLTDIFKYPIYGPSMMYEEMAKIISMNVNFKIKLNSEVIKLGYKNKKWSITIKEKNKTYTKEYDEIVSTMPLTLLILNMDYEIPDNIIYIVQNLKYRSFLTACIAFDKPNKLEDTWIYIHDPLIKAGRLQVLNNWSPYFVKENTSAYGVEYFCDENDDLWNTPDDELINLAVNEIKKIKLIPMDYNLIQGRIIRIKKTYPIYDNFYGENMIHIKNFLKSIPNLQVAGRCGMFRYNNMDHSMYTGILAAKNLIEESMNHNPWLINQDREYHEEEFKKEDMTVVST